jgi:uridine kinase
MDTTPEALRDRLARAIVALAPGRFLRIGIDGVDGVGKTTFADGLGAAVAALGRPVLRASADDVLNPRARRYRLGRDSPEGFFRDTYDLAALRRCLLAPLAPGGCGLHRRAVFDPAADAPLPEAWEQAPPGAALILDGMFLHRPELRDLWDLSLLLVAPFAVTVPRGASRGPGYGAPDPAAPTNRRYVEGQRRYFAACDPAARAAVVVEHSDLAAPRILVWRLPREAAT